MPKSNGSVVGAGAPVPLPAPVPRMGSNREMTTPLLGPPTPPYRKLIQNIKINVSPFVVQNCLRPSQIEQ